MEEDKNIKTQIDALKIEEIEEFQEIAQPFISLMMEFRCALMEIETKLNVLNSEFALTHNRNPIQTIKTRLKQPVSILEKLHRKELEVNIFNVEEYLADIAGVRVICSFPEDIYTVADLLLHQDDIRMLEIKEYIDVHFNEELNLNMLGEKFFLHPTTISKDFTKYCGYNLNKYINTVRVCEAASLLENSSDSVAVIAERCGYDSVNTFLRQFKSIMDVSPLQYRKSAHEWWETSRRCRRK